MKLNTDVHAQPRMIYNFLKAPYCKEYSCHVCLCLRTSVIKRLSKIADGEVFKTGRNIHLDVAKVSDRDVRMNRLVFGDQKSKVKVCDPAVIIFHAQIMAKSHMRLNICRGL